MRDDTLAIVHWVFIVVRPQHNDHVDLAPSLEPMGKRVGRVPNWRDGLLLGLPVRVAVVPEQFERIFSSGLLCWLCV